MQHVTRRSRLDKCVLAALPGRAAVPTSVPFLPSCFSSTFLQPSRQELLKVTWGSRPQRRLLKTPLTGSGINITPLGGRGRKEGGI